MSEYLELYKKYKPQRWEDLIGQEMVANSLQKAVVANALPTGFMFQGQYGTGKTSSAFLLAKAINCINPPGDGNPCNQCDVCISIEQQVQPGVQYISMANNGSVDEVRRIVDDLKYSQPVKIPVIIADEVQNLSTQGQDALLIPLENLQNVLLIFCTTETKSTKFTVSSRIKTRTFHKISSEKLHAFLEDICKKENIELNESTQYAIHVALKKCHGSARDALTKFEDALEVKETDGKYNDRLLESLQKRDTVGALSIVAEADTNSVPLIELMETMLADLRTIMLLSENVSEETAGISPVNNPHKFSDKIYGTSSIIYAITELSEAYSKVISGAQARALFEVFLIKYINLLATKDRKNS